jgi:ADP-heptose:LPS heptosyltransferase
VGHIRKLHPDAFIIWASEKDYRVLADSHPEINYTLAVKCISEWMKFARWNLFDEIVDLNLYGRTCSICGVPWIKPRGDHGVTAENFDTCGSLLNTFTKAAGIVVMPARPNVFPQNEDVRLIDELQLPKTFISIHAGANEAKKVIPADKWEQIVKYINNRWHLPVVEVGLKPLVLSNPQSPNRQLCGQLSILQSAEVIRRSIAYLGSDSGPAHLANAVGAYGIIMFGHYSNFQHRDMPYTGRFAEGRDCELLYHDGPVAEIPIERCFAAIDRRLAGLSSVTGEIR